MFTRCMVHHTNEVILAVISNGYALQHDPPKHTLSNDNVTPHTTHVYMTSHTSPHQDVVDREHCQ
jgi:hypothetical protein